jgi:hypothetical protein
MNNLELGRVDESGVWDSPLNQDDSGWTVEGDCRRFGVEDGKVRDARIQQTEREELLKKSNASPGDLTERFNRHHFFLP